MSWDANWSVEDWLERLGLAFYAEPFIDNGYDLQELCANLKAEDMDAIGVQKEHRKRIFAESSTLREEAMARFKKSKGGGSSGSTDHSGSMGSHGSFPAYTEPWGDEVPKHLYSDVWEQHQVDAPSSGHGITPALAQLMQNGGHERSDVADKQKGLTFPPVVPSKSPRRKQKLPTSPGLQPLPAVPRPAQATAGGLNKLQLKLKVLEELQKDRIILSEAPYSKDGTVNEEKMSELCQTYSERFHIEPAQVMETMRVICKPTDSKGHEENDGSSNFLVVQKTPVLSSSDIYEEPVDVMREDLTTFKDASPPTKPKRVKAQISTAEVIYSEPLGVVSLPNSPQKKGKNKASPVFLQKPKHSSSESSPEQKRRVSPRSSPQVSPRCSPRASPVTSPRENKKFSFFGKRKTKKAARSNSVKDIDLHKNSTKAGGKAVLMSGHPLTGTSSEGVVSARPLASKKRSARASLSLDHHPLSSTPAATNKQSPPEIKNRTVSMSSTSTTGSETSPVPPKKFGVMRFSQRLDSPHKAKSGHGGQNKSHTASDISLNKVGLKPEQEKQKKLIRNAQSCEHLIDTGVSPNHSPATVQRTNIESKQKGGIFRFKLRKKKKAKKGKSLKNEEEEMEGEGKEERGGDREEGRSFLTSSTSMPNIASVIQLEQSPEPSPQTSQGRLHKSATAPPKPSRRVRIQSPLSIPAPSPDPSPLPQRKVVQSHSMSSGDSLIPISQERGDNRGDNISSWKPVSPSHMLLNPPQVFESDALSGATPQECIADFQEPSRNPQRTSVSSHTSPDVVSSSAYKNRELSASVESHESSVFGSYSSSNSLPVAKSSSSGSLKKTPPPPPPKPKSLERGLKSKGFTIKRPMTEAQGIRKSSGGSDSGVVTTNERVTPPPKPPRPLRGSIRKESVDNVKKEGEKRGGGEVGEIVPPPKPARRNRSVKMLERNVVIPEKKSQTMQVRTSSQSSTESVPGTSRKPIPTPKPWFGMSQGQSSTASIVPPLSLEDRLKSQLSKECIDLTDTPYSTVFGEWGVPSFLISRYAEEFDHPPESIGLVLDEIRGQELKKINRDYIPFSRIDCMKNTIISTDSIPAFLTSIGLPMYTSVLTKTRGFVNFQSLYRLNHASLQKLNIAPLHRKILMEQLHT